MNWLPPEYRILYSSFDKQINIRYNGDAFKNIYERLFEFFSSGSLFFSYEDSIIALCSGIEIIEDKICFILRELRPDSLYNVNFQEYEAYISIEGCPDIESVSNIIEIRRKKC